jgi:hypothetical protein
MLKNPIYPSLRRKPESRFVPAKAGNYAKKDWIPAFAGMTKKRS